MGNDAPIAIVGGLIIDGTERDPIEQGVLVIDGGKVAAVGEARHVSVPRNARRVDAVGKVVTPGLIDAHMHFFGSRSPDPREWVLEPPMLNCVRAVSDAWKILDVGITTIRDLGSRNSIALRNAVNEAVILGPRVVAAGLGLSQTCGHGDVHQLPRAPSPAARAGTLRGASVGTGQKAGAGSQASADRRQAWRVEPPTPTR